MKKIRKKRGPIPARRLKAFGGAVALAGLFSSGLVMKHHNGMRHHAQLPEHAAGESLDRSLASLDPNEMEWLARNIYHEARGESWEGMLAVGVVTLNRVSASGYPDTIEGVVKQYKQFSWYWDGRSDRVKNREAWKKAKAAAAEVMLNPDNPVAKRLAGVLFYHADYVRPYWAGSHEHVATVGRHVFYM